MTQTGEFKGHVI